MVRIALALSLVAAAAAADADEALRLDLTVGDTVTRDVGFAIGLLCDDLTIVRAELRASTPESNTFVVTGLAEGTTTCRVGTSLHRPSYVFEIHVAPPRHRR
jgi:hypothetical protein